MTRCCGTYIAWQFLEDALSDEDKKRVVDMIASMHHAQQHGMEYRASLGALFCSVNGREWKIEQAIEVAKKRGGSVDVGTSGDGKNSQAVVRFTF